MIVSGKLENRTPVQWRAWKMFGMFTIEKISSFSAGFTHIQNMTCSCQGNEITHEFVFWDFYFYFDQRWYAQSVRVATHAAGGCGNCLQVLWNFYPNLLLRPALKYLYCDLLLITFSAFSIKFNKTGFLSLTEAGLQEIGRCDQVAIIRISFL